MLRIFAGKHRGRKLQMVDTKQLRPTAGRTREAIFNILNHGRFAEGGTRFLEGCKVVDLFCGSGALGLEALSHGAAHCVFIDIDQDHLSVARANAEHVGESKNVTFIRCDSSSPPTAKFACDLVFIDPPYHSKLVVTALKNLAARGWLRPGSVVMVEMEKRETLPEMEGYIPITDRIYGKTRIVLLEWQPVAAVPQTIKDAAESP